MRVGCKNAAFSDNQAAKFAFGTQPFVAPAT
jgi:hypothetical protein